MQKNQVAAPLVSVIMPAYNAARFIEEAILSVIAQTVSDWELIVIDDCSQDNTRDIIAELAKKDSRILFVANEQNMGVAKTRNRGLDICRGRYVAFLDSDDYWQPVFMEKMIARAEETGADIIYCSYALVDEQDKPVCNDFLVPLETTFEESIIRSVITCSSVLITAQLASNHRFPTNMYHEDIALWFRILQEGGTARGVAEILAAYRQRKDSRSADKLISACRRWPIYRKHLHLPFFRTIGVMIRYGYYGMVKFKRI